MSSVVLLFSVHVSVDVLPAFAGLCPCLALGAILVTSFAAPNNAVGTTQCECLEAGLSTLHTLQHPACFSVQEAHYSVPSPVVIAPVVRAGCKA